MNNSQNLFSSIRNIQPTCEKIDDLEKWQENLNNDILSVLHINLMNLNTNWDLLCLKIEKLLPKLDLLVLTEIKVNEEQALSYQLRNFVQFSKCRKIRKGGGVMVFYRNSFIMENMSYNLDECENVYFELTHSETRIKFSILAIYRSPKFDIDKFLNDFDFLLSNGIRKDSSLIIIGDININTLKKTNKSSRYLNILYDNTVLPTINYSTREELRDGLLTESCIDHANIRLKNNHFTYSSAVIYDKLADHYFIALKISRKTNVVTRKPPEYVKIIDNRKVQAEIEKENWSPLEHSNNPNELYMYVVNKLNLIYENSTKTVLKKEQSESTPWISERVKIEIKKRKFLLDSWRKNKSNLIIYEEYKQQRNIATNLIKKEKRIYLFKLFREAEGNMLKTWRIINDVMDRKIREPLDIKLQRNFQTSDLQQLANNFNSNFIDQIIELKRKNNGPYLELEMNNYEPHALKTSMYLRKAREKDIYGILKNIKKTGKGIDGIRHRDIVENPLIFTPCITKIINSMLEKASIPDDLKKSSITPLYKKGSTDVLSNYRPVGSMPIIEKVFEKFINIQTQKYLDDNQIIPSFQHGFQRGKSTITLLQEFSNQINTALDQRKCVVIVLLDLSFAYDTCSHELLLKKFNDVGITHPIFKNYFVNRKQVTRIGTVVSAEKNVEHGLIQGGINSATWFNIYTHDVKHIKLTGTLRMFADDSCIVSIHTDVSTAIKNAQNDFVNLQKYFYNNNIFLNEKKTEVLILGYQSKRINLNNYKLYCHSRECLEKKMYEIYCTCNQIEYKQDAKYLGLYIDNDFRMKQHAINLSKKLRIVKYKFHKINADRLPLSTRKTLYFSLIDSLLRYGVTLYTYAQEYVKKPLKTLQRKVLNFLFKGLNINNLNIEQLNTYVLILENFHNKDYQKLVSHNYTLRTQRFIRTQVYTKLYGNRRLEYIMPTLINRYCTDFLNEKSRTSLKRKLKESILGT